MIVSINRFNCNNRPTPKLKNLSIPDVGLYAFSEFGIYIFICLISEHFAVNSRPPEKGPLVEDKNALKLNKHKNSPINSLNVCVCIRLLVLKGLNVKRYKRFLKSFRNQ